MAELIDTSEATAIIADYFDEICDTDVTFNENEILRRLNKSAVTDSELEYRKAKAPVFMTHRYIDEETGKEGTWTSVHCPVCFNNEKVRLWNSLISRDTAFCSRCGQKIKWEKEHAKNDNA